MLNLNEESIYSYCKNGSTLIQKRAPFIGNRRSRTLKWDIECDKSKRKKSFHLNINSKLLVHGNWSCSLHQYPRKWITINKRKDSSDFYSFDQNCNILNHKCCSNHVEITWKSRLYYLVIHHCNEVYFTGNANINHEER